MKNKQKFKLISTVKKSIKYKTKSYYVTQNKIIY